MLNTQGQIGSKYIIKELIDEGLTAKVYLVEDKETKKEYAAKIFKKLKNVDPTIEIYYLNKLKKINNQNIINIIDAGEDEIIGVEKNSKKVNYIILEYATYGKIYDYIINKGLGELYGKILFSKIINGIQACHNNGICHRDLKLQNILFDKDFNPKISDFGFACQNDTNLKEILGTEPYMPPEIIKQKEKPNKEKVISQIFHYDGFKVDIFCLGALLIQIVTGHSGFETATPSDMLYTKLYNHSDNYWKIFNKKYPEITLSEEFKDLYFKLIRVNPMTRPNIEDILKDIWFKEINKMNKEKLEKLEQEMREIFINLVPVIKKKSQITASTKGKTSDKDQQNRSNDKQIYYITNINLEPEYINIPLNMNYCIKIKGYLDPIEFMNSLCNEINKKYGKDNCFIEFDKNILKFSVTFEKDEENYEITEEEKEELKKLGIDYENMKDDDESNDLVIQVKLYKTPEIYALKFIHEKGNRNEFLDNFDIISDLVKKIL